MKHSRGNAPGRMRTGVVGVLAGLVPLLVAGPVQSQVTAQAVKGDITVLAAASLTESFTEIGRAFESDNPGTSVKFSFASSNSLATQANQGAPADVFASADESNMAKVTEVGNARDPVIFARNRLAILTGKGNPKGIARLQDFNRDDLIYVICARQVPCGYYAGLALDRAGVKREPASYEENVKAVVYKVRTGEADTGIVYFTDAKAAAGSTSSVEIPPAANVIARYPIATLKQSGNPDTANAFKAYVASGPGQQILARYGFLPPA